MTPPQDPNYLYFDKRFFEIMAPKQRRDEYLDRTSDEWEVVVNEHGGFFDPQYRRPRSLCTPAQIEAVEGKKEPTTIEKPVEANRRALPPDVEVEVRKAARESAAGLLKAFAGENEQPVCTCPGAPEDASSHVIGCPAFGVKCEQSICNCSFGRKETVGHELECPLFGHQPHGEENHFKKLMEQPSLGGNLGEEIVVESDDGMCKKCGGFYELRENSEDTGICDECAQNFYENHNGIAANIVELEKKLAGFVVANEELNSRLCGALAQRDDTASKYETERTLLEHANFKVKELESTINDLRQKLAQKAVMMRAEFDVELSKVEYERDQWQKNTADAVISVLECRDMLDPNGNLSLKDAAEALQLRNQQLESELASPPGMKPEMITALIAERDGWKVKVEKLEADAAAMRFAIEETESHMSSFDYLVRLENFYTDDDVSYAKHEKEAFLKNHKLLCDALSATAGKSLLAKMERMEKDAVKLKTALNTIATYDSESIWMDDRDDAANAMLDVAREALSESSEGREK